jgi:hypothetical protein
VLGWRLVLIAAKPMADDLSTVLIPFSGGGAEAFRVVRIARLDQPAFSLLRHN